METEITVEAIVEELLEQRTKRRLTNAEMQFLKENDQRIPVVHNNPEKYQGGTTDCCNEVCSIDDFVEDLINDEHGINIVEKIIKELQNEKLKLDTRVAEIEVELEAYDLIWHVCSTLDHKETNWLVKATELVRTLLDKTKT